MSHHKANPVEFIHLETRIAQQAPSISSFDFHLIRPLIINNVNNSMKITDFYLSISGERWHSNAAPLRLHISGAGREAIKDRRMTPAASFACLMPDPQAKMHHGHGITALPLAPGIYTMLTVSISDIDCNPIKFDHLIMTIQISQ